MRILCILFLCSIVSVTAMEVQPSDIETGQSKEVSQDEQKSIFRFIKRTFLGSRGKSERRFFMNPVKDRISSLNPASPDDQHVIAAIKTLTTSSEDAVDSSGAVQSLKDFIIGVTAEEAHRYKKEADGRWKKSAVLKIGGIITTSVSAAVSLTIYLLQNQQC